MKYPTCCYRIGNEFESYGKSKQGKVPFRRFTYESHDKNHIYGINEEMYKHCNVEIVSITAETLAELARENEDLVKMHFSQKGLVTVDLYKPEQMGSYFVSDKFKPLGEFFLRVAKERKYII